MKRHMSFLAFPLMLTLALVSCGGGEPEAEPDTMPEQSPEAADQAAIEALREGWVTHYNLHHADMVADFYADSSWVLNADMRVDEGRDAIEAALAEAMADNPTATVTTRETRIFGDQAVSIGTYEVTVAPEGAETMSLSGHFMNYLTRVDGEWKITGLITNYDSPRPEGWMWAEDSGETPPEQGTMTELIEGFETHWNLQHPDMVADFYAPDAVVSWANRTTLEGRDAVAAALRERQAEMPTEIDVHAVGTMDLADGWALDGGWYELTAVDGGETVQTGMYMHLLQRADDGSWQIRWAVSNGRPGAMP
jgi:uncharacterized protein (TIGR02246 family)